MKTLNEIAEILIGNNPKLKELATQEQGYKDVKSQLNGAVMAKVGSAHGKFVNKHEFTWTIINVANGTATESLDLDGL